MANALYPKSKETALGAGMGLSAGTCSAATFKTYGAISA